MPIIPFTQEAHPHATAPEALLNVFGSWEAARDPLQLVLLAQRGLSAGKAHAISEWLHLDNNQMADLLGIASKTWRYYQHEHKVLDAAKSEQVLKLAQVAALGQEVFGEAAAFLRWLQKPAYGLASKRPLDLFYTSGGIDLVTDELTRIAYGDLA